MSQHELPDRSDLIGKEVKIKLHRWAAKGPERGIFNGQAERGLSITTPDGGRHIYRHSEVKSVRLVRRRIWKRGPR
jgi:hypothetical protein